MNKFIDLGINESLVRAVEELGFVSPTPIQEQSIPQLVGGENDFIGLAQTGTGKTAAFGLPALQNVDTDFNHPQVLVIAPTRELCVQIADDLRNFSKYNKRVKIAAVFGGASIENQISQLRQGAHVIAATPGRLIDLLNRRALVLDHIRIVALDEADEMLNMGFQEDIDNILERTPDTKKTWLFSATMPKEIRRIAQRYMHEPVEVTCGRANTGNENIEHRYYVVNGRDKYAALKRIVDIEPDIFGIIFCRTKLDSQDIAEKLVQQGYNADALHGDLSQAQRNKVMKRFKDRSLQLLVATDVAARGIDVNDITHVINFSLPEDTESYTHRSGRTARAGKKGICMSLVMKRDVDIIRRIEKVINQKFTRCDVPTGDAVCEKQLLHVIEKIKDAKVDVQAMEKYMPEIYKALDGVERDELIQRIAALEFSRFVDYYKGSVDINVSEGNRGDRPERGERGEGKRDFGGNSNEDRLFVNLGKMDGMNFDQLRQFLAESAGLQTEQVGRIDMKDSFSFIQIEKSLSDQLQNGIKGVMYNDRRVRIEASGGGRGGEDRGGSGRREGGNRGGEGRFDRNKRSSSGGFRSERSGGASDRPERGSSSRSSDRQPRSSSTRPSSTDRNERGGNSARNTQKSRPSTPSKKKEDNWEDLIPNLKIEGTDFSY